MQTEQSPNKNNIEVTETFEMKMCRFLSKYQTEYAPITSDEKTVPYLDPKTKSFEERQREFMKALSLIPRSRARRYIYIAKITGNGPDYIEEIELRRASKGILGRLKKPELIKTQRPALPEERTLQKFEVICCFQIAGSVFTLRVEKEDQIENTEELAKRLSEEFPNNTINIYLNMDIDRKRKPKEDLTL